MPNDRIALRRHSDDSYTRTVRQPRLTFRDSVDSASDDQDLRIEYHTANPTRDLINVVQDAGKRLAPYVQRFAPASEPVTPVPSAPFLPTRAPTSRPRTKKPIGKTVNVKVPLNFSYSDTGLPVNQHELAYLVDRPYAQKYFSDTGVITKIPEHLEQKGTYVMSRQGKSALSNTARVPRRSGALSNVFRGTNTSSTRNAPAAISRRMNVVNKPRMTASRNGIVVRHKEYMSNILSNATSLGFNAIGLTLNPGKVAAFPWLSTIAVNFDKYRILSCTISLVTNQPTTTAGRVGVGFDYDSTDPIPDDRTDFFSLTHHAECAAWDSLDFKIPLQGGTRFVNTHTSTDSKLIDYGQVIIMSDQIVTSGTAVNLGDVIIDYAVELIDPQQAVMLTYNLLGLNASTFAGMQQIGPAFPDLVSTSSTTVVDHKLPIGYFLINVSLYDGGGGTPVAALSATTGTLGKVHGVGSTTLYNLVSIIHTLQDDTTIRVTYSGVTIANLETSFISITRISPSIYTKNTVSGAWASNITANL